MLKDAVKSKLISIFAFSAFINHPVSLTSNLLLGNDTSLCEDLTTPQLEVVSGVHESSSH